MKYEKYLVDEFCIFFFFFLHLYKKWQMRNLYLTKRRWKGSNGSFSLQILNYFVDLHVWAKRKKSWALFGLCLFIKFYSERLIFSGSDSFGSKRLIWQVRSVRDNKICFFFSTISYVRTTNNSCLLCIASVNHGWWSLWNVNWRLRYINVSAHVSFVKMSEWVFILCIFVLCSRFLLGLHVFSFPFGFAVKELNFRKE